MANPTASVSVNYFSCWIDEFAPLSNPVLPYPTELPTPIIIPADHCSHLIFQWLHQVATVNMTPQAIQLEYEAMPYAFDTIDQAAYAADLAVIAAQYNTDVAQVIANYRTDKDSREANMAACEARRYPEPDPSDSGVKIIVLTSKLPTSSSSHLAGGLRTTLKLRLSAA